MALPPGCRKASTSREKRLRRHRDSNRIGIKGLKGDRLIEQRNGAGDKRRRRPQHSRHGCLRSLWRQIKGIGQLRAGREVGRQGGDAEEAEVASASWLAAAATSGGGGGGGGTPWRRCTGAACPWRAVRDTPGTQR